MKKVALSSFVFLFLFSLIACHRNDDKKETATNTINTLPSNPELKSKQAKESLMSLTRFSGQYPSDVALLDNPLLEMRLKELLGNDYNNFRKYWNTETPIIIEDNVLSTTGCEEHNCGANLYILQIDLKNNNINVYHFGKVINSYLERGKIELPQGLEKEFSTMISNQQI